MQGAHMPNAFTAPFDAGLLSYQVMRDFPPVVLIDVFWLDQPEGLGQGILNPPRFLGTPPFRPCRDLLPIPQPATNTLTDGSGEA